MSGSKDVDPIWSVYWKATIWKFLPKIGSCVVVAILIASNLILLENEAAHIDSILPFVESHRIDNLLLQMTLASGLGILAYFILAFLTKAYFTSVTESSELVGLLERVKTKMGIDLNTQLRIHDEDGLNIVTERNAVFSSIVMSREAQTAILEQQDMGEVVLAGELSSLEYTRPWIEIGAFATFFGLAWVYIFPHQYKLSLVGVYGMMSLLTEMVLPFLLMLMAAGLHSLSRSSFINSYAATIKEYQISPSLAKRIVFEKLVITEEDIEKRTKSSYKITRSINKIPDKVCAIILIGSVSVFLIWGIILNMYTVLDIPPPLDLPLWMLLSLFAIMISFAIPAFIYDDW